MEALDATLHAALATGDSAAIVDAYDAAAHHMFAAQNHDAGYFLLTHAYIHALEAGLPKEPEIAARLRAAKRL